MSHVTRFRIFILLATASFVLASSEAYSQSIPYWTKIATFQNAGITDVYFIDTLHGIVCLDTGSVITPSAEIYYTPDQVTWHHSVTPPIGSVNAIRYINGKLYAAVMAQDILISTDSGATWNFSGLGLANA